MLLKVFTNRDISYRAGCSKHWSHVCHLLKADNHSKISFQGSLDDKSEI